MEKEFKKVLTKNQEIDISGSYVKDYHDTGCHDFNIPVSCGFTGTEYEKMVQEAYRNLSTRKNKYYISGSGKIKTRIISFIDHPSISSISSFHNLDFISYDSVRREIKVEVIIKMELGRIKKERTKYSGLKRNDIYFKNLETAS